MQARYPSSESAAGGPRPAAWRLVATAAAVLGLCLLPGLPAPPAGLAQAGEARCAGPGDWRNELELAGLSGGSIECETLAGEPVVLQFWASWCGSCRKLLSEIDTVAAQFPSVRFLAVSIDEEVADARRALEAQSLLAEHPDRYYHDADRALMQRLKVDTIPALLVLDAGGEERLRLRGHVEPAALSGIAEHLTEMRTTGGGSPP